MQNGNKCKNSCKSWLNNPVDSVIRTISWGTKVCGLVRNHCTCITRSLWMPHYNRIVASITINHVGNMEILSHIWACCRSMNDEWRLRAYSHQRRAFFSAAEILLRIYQNPIHLNGTRWRTRFWRQREVRRRKNEFPQPKKTRVFGVNRP